MKLERREHSIEVEKPLNSVAAVSAVFAYSGLETFPYKMKFLQDFFRESKEKRRYSKLLQDLSYSKPGHDIYPFSRDLSECMSILNFVLAWNEPGGMRATKYRVDQESRDEMIKLVLHDAPSEKDQKLLKELGKNFKKAVKKFYIQEEKEIEKSFSHPRKIHPIQKKFFTIFSSNNKK